MEASKVKPLPSPRAFEWSTWIGKLQEAGALESRQRYPESAVRMGNRISAAIEKESSARGRVGLRT